MAKRATMKGGAPEREIKGVNADDLRRVVGDILRQKETASEYAGHAGQSTKNAVENYNLDRKALGVIIALKKADDQKRQATLRGIIEYAHKMGFFDQVDAFSDVTDLLRAIVKDADERQTNSTGKPSKADPVVGAMLN